MIAASSEVQCGIENMCQRGRSNGIKDYANSSMHTGYFSKELAFAAPYYFWDKKQWHLDKRDEPWDELLPCLNKHDEKRRMLMILMLLALDRSMPGWCSKTSKLRVISNCTHKPRK